MNGVAAEVAQKVGVLLQDDNIDAGTGQEKAKHHARRPAAGDAALCGDRCVVHTLDDIAIKWLYRESNGSIAI
jgi:hypothetical protein